MKDLLLCVHVVVKTLNLEIFTLSFGRLRQTIVLKCVLHVQHDYFSSFNQSDHCFLASSLWLPSSPLKLPDLPIVDDGEGRGRNPVPTLPLNKKMKGKMVSSFLASIPYYLSRLYGLCMARCCSRVCFQCDASN